mmetsp:Transcript_47772/g.133054  ORF Transcript_47772/g.133054 Transcript_47772/m.133054 type:complete len:220 (+) Transcript_47772:263-922(+)
MALREPALPTRHPQGRPPFRRAALPLLPLRHHVLRHLRDGGPEVQLPLGGADLQVRPHRLRAGHGGGPRLRRGRRGLAGRPPQRLELARADLRGAAQGHRSEDLRRLRHGLGRHRARAAHLVDPGAGLRPPPPLALRLGGERRAAPLAALRAVAPRLGGPQGQAGLGRDPEHAGAGGPPAVELLPGGGRLTGPCERRESDRFRQTAPPVCALAPWHAAV